MYFNGPKHFEIYEFQKNNFKKINESKNYLDKLYLKNNSKKYKKISRINEKNI